MYRRRISGKKPELSPLQLVFRKQMILISVIYYYPFWILVIADNSFHINIHSSGESKAFIIQETKPLSTIIFLVYGFYTCLFIIKIEQGNYQSAPIDHLAPWCNSNPTPTWWWRSVIPARTVTPSHAWRSLVQKEHEISDGTNTTTVSGTLAIFLVEVLLHWEPRLLKPQSQKLQELEGQISHVGYWEWL